MNLYHLRKQAPSRSAGATPNHKPIIIFQVKIILVVFLYISKYEILLKKKTTNLIYYCKNSLINKIQLDLLYTYY